MRQLWWIVEIDLKSFCLVWLFETGCIERVSVVWSQTDTYICPSPKRFIFPLCVFSWDWQTCKHIGGPFIRGISSPQLLHVAPGSLPIYYHCKAPCLCPPPLQNLYKNIFERLSQGSVMPWQQRQRYRLLPASETISCFTHLCGEITKETLLTNHIRILAQFSESLLNSGR